MFPVPEYIPTEPPATTTDKLFYQNITLERAIEIVGREIPVPAYLPAGYGITSVKVESTSQPLSEWRIGLTIDNGTSSSPITMSISTFTLGMKIPPGFETVKIGNSTARVSRQEDSIDLDWINNTGWGLSLVGSDSMTFEELLKIAESVTSPPREVLKANIVPDEDLLVLREESRNITIHLQSNSSTSIEISITRDTRTSTLPTGIDITATQTSSTLSPGQSLDVKINVKVGNEVISPAWNYRPESSILSTDSPPPFSGGITEEPYYRLNFMVLYEYSIYDNTPVQSHVSLGTEIRIDEPTVLPSGMVTLREAEEAADFPVGLLLPSYFPEGTNPVPTGCNIGNEEPHVITVFYSDYQVVFSPEQGVTEPPEGFTGEKAIIRKKTAFIGQDRIDWWIYDIHFSVISDKVSIDELKYIAESMMLIAPYSESWLEAK
jgi:hypothetical protein